MGIRVTCPNGHQLNVKDYLAGKRGICPHCQSRFEIPAQPTPEVVASAPIVVPRPAQRGAVLREPTQSAPVEVAPVTPVAVTPSVTPQPVVAATPVADVPPPAPQVAAATTPAAAELIWYVRPATGGQYGPADTTLMQQWVTEGRVPPDALVWRTGWTDWLRADVAADQLPGKLAQAIEVPADFDAGRSMEVATVANTDPTSAAATAAARLQRKRRAAARTQAWIAGLLLLVAVVLGIVLVIVLRPPASTPPAADPPAAETTPAAAPAPAAEEATES